MLKGCYHGKTWALRRYHAGLVSIQVISHVKGKVRSSCFRVTWQRLQTQQVSIQVISHVKGKSISLLHGSGGQNVKLFPFK
jgi:hypothetical protein